ncbi:methylmalonyl Co-A mutase-associated GTPase MeaB [Pseudomaricurvus alkylphenolicus]|jgi:LAO/AO transport system kinase|uniref:methylmalonyl Co-A mutase-associated GTPase MeaB n=1 Tax=Pseudomaricurvus alkylphenolicus TaxID=1306991 RepID=UPI00197EB4DE|nr:methylmalonyl Co-A mutase-associated GTPase MeaB [Pseudomaricurvus alkylphenolicus]
MPSINLELLRQGNRRALAKAITLVESKLDKHRSESQQVLEDILPDTGKSIRIGISGIPGVGKSTFIEAFGKHLIDQGKKVAVLAVDPSSPLRGGSILGDKTRMEELSREDNAFIRPSPSEGALGGVAQKTRETMLLCEAAGYDVILVETVGVGQSEYEVAAMVDFFLVLMIPNAGDELQGIKRGIMELADALVINKADGESINLAQRTKSHYQNAFHLIKHGSFWNPRVETCSALQKERIGDIWEMICDYQKAALENDAFFEKRALQNSEWLNKLIHEMLEMRLNQNPQVQSKMPGLQKAVEDNTTTPYNAAKQIVDLL